MSVLSKLITLSAAGGGPVDAQLSSLLAEQFSSNTENTRALNFVATNDPSKFLLFWFSADYYRGAVVTVSNGTVSIGSSTTLVYNRNWNDHYNAGWRWHPGAGAAYGVVIDDNTDQIRAAKVTYSGTSLSVSLSSAFEAAGTYRTPRGGYGAACQYDPINNVFLAIYTDSSAIYVRPFTSTFSIGSRQGTGLSHNGFYFAASFYKADTRDLFVVGLGYDFGSTYWNTVASTRYSGGTNGSFSANFTNVNYNTIGTSGIEPTLAYNEKENVLWLTSEQYTNGYFYGRMFPCVPQSNGTLVRGTGYYFNVNNPSTPITNTSSSVLGATYDPVSEAVIFGGRTGQYDTALYQARATGTSLTSLKQVGSLFNIVSITNNQATYDTANKRTLLSYGNGKNPTSTPSYWVSINSLSG